MSVHCPFYVVLLVNLHKKQCNVKRALASNAVRLAAHFMDGVAQSIKRQLGRKCVIIE